MGKPPRQPAVWGPDDRGEKGTHGAAGQREKPLQVQSNMRGVGGGGIVEFIQRTRLLETWGN